MGYPQSLFSICFLINFIVMSSYACTETKLLIEMQKKQERIISVKGTDQQTKVRTI